MTDRTDRQTHPHTEMMTPILTLKGTNTKSPGGPAGPGGPGGPGSPYNETQIT